MYVAVITLTDNMYLNLEKMELEKLITYRERWERERVRRSVYLKKKRCI